MKYSTNKYLNYLIGLLKGCNVLACVAVSILIMLTVYFFDGFNLVSSLIYRGGFVESVVIITAVLGVLFTIASAIKNLEKKHITYADNMLVGGVLLFIFATVYCFITNSKLFLLLKILAIACLGVAILALFFLRAKFFESVEDKTRLKSNANVSAYYQNLFKRDWPFIILLSIATAVLLVYLYVSNFIDDFILANNTMQIFFTIASLFVSVFVFLLGIRVREKEQNLIDCTVFASYIASFVLFIIGFMKTDKLRVGSIILALAMLVFALVCTILLIKSTFIPDESKYKLKKGNALLYFKNLFKNGNVVLYLGVAFIITAVMAVLESTNLIHKLYETQLGGKDPAIVVELVIVSIVTVFTFLLTELQNHKVHGADKIVFTMAIAFALILIIVNGILGVEFIFEGLIALIGLVLSVAFIALRTFFVKDFEEELIECIDAQSQEQPTPCVCEENVVVENAVEEQAVTKEEEPIKLKRVNVKKSFEIYVRTGDEQLKENYSQIKNALLSYGLHARLTKSRENFSKKGVTLSKIKEGKEIRLQAKLFVRGKFLKLYINVDPSSVDLKYFRATDVSSKMPDQPLYVKIRTKLSLKRALELIDILAVQENFNSKKKFTEVDYASLLTSEGLTYMQKLGYDYMVKDSVTYEEVATLNDEWAEKIVKTELIKDPQRYIYDEVTLKDLEENFEDGSVVSLEAMRQKGLVKINANYITVKASQSLSKKLIVEGNVIEPKAIAMLFIAGGEATRLIGE